MIDFFQFYSPTRIVAGKPGLLGELAPELAPFAGLRAGVVTDPVLGAMAYFRSLEASLAAVGIAVGAVYMDVPQDSDVDVVHAVRDLFAANQCDLIIAVGGGSVIDTAKAVNIVMTLRSTTAWSVLSMPWRTRSAGLRGCRTESPTVSC